MCQLSKAEQKLPLGFLSTLPAFCNLPHMGWLPIDVIGDSHKYAGPLPKDCPCAVTHKPTVALSEDNNFLSSLSLSLGDQLWRTYWSALCKEPFSLREGADFQKVSSPEGYPRSARSGSLLSPLSRWENGSIFAGAFDKVSLGAALPNITVDTRRSRYFLGRSRPFRSRATGLLLWVTNCGPAGFVVEHVFLTGSEGHWLACTVLNATTYKRAPASDGAEGRWQCRSPVVFFYAACGSECFQS